MILKGGEGGWRKIRPCRRRQRERDGWSTPDWRREERERGREREGGREERRFVHHELTL